MTREKDDKQWSSPFGKILNEEYLSKIGWIQQDLATKSKIDSGIISHMVAGRSVGFGQGEKCVERMNKILRALSSRMPLHSDKVRTLLQHIPKNNLTDAERESLITKLVSEGIVTPVYFTIQGRPVIGRNEIIQVIHTKLQDEHKRLLTLFGTPGVGKTELAHQIEELEKTQGYFASVRYRSIVNLREINDVLAFIRKELPSTNIKERTLLILDNCEQIRDLSAASAELYTFLNEQPKLTILATSRAIFGENNYEVETLTVPPTTDTPLETLLTNDAVMVFLQGVDFSKRDNNDLIPLNDPNNEAPILAEVCQLLDGIPLALLIAGSWVKETTIKGLHAILMDMTIQEREYPFYDKDEQMKHVSLDRLIAWSYDLLGEHERGEYEKMLFRWLTAFPTPSLSYIKLPTFSPLTELPILSLPLTRYPYVIEIVAVISLCGLGDFPAKDDVYNILKTLNNHSMITYIDQYVGIHNTLRSYGRRQLDQAEEAPDLRSILLSYHMFCRRQYCMDWYKREDLEKIAASQKFLEEEADDQTLVKDLDEILSIYTFGEIDIFIRESPYYPAFLQIVVKYYRDYGVKGLSYEEKRYVFFQVLDAIYKKMLTPILEKELEIFINEFNEYGTEQLNEGIQTDWQIWDSKCGSLFGF